MKPLLPIILSLLPSVIYAFLIVIKSSKFYNNTSTAKNFLIILNADVDRPPKPKLFAANKNPQRFFVELLNGLFYLDRPISRTPL